MEYFLGSVMTLVAVYFMNRLVSKSRLINKKIESVKFSQSYNFELTRYLIPIEDLQPSFRAKKKTQASVHFDKNSTRVLYMDGMAWFIKNLNGIDALFSAEIIDGAFDETSAKRVDTMAMDDVELKKTIFIVEKLTEGL